MSEVKKWHMPRGTSVSEGEDGEFVLASDYDAIAEECERLRREAKNDAIAYKAAIERQNEIRTERDAAIAELAALKGGQEAVAWAVCREPGKVDALSAAYASESAAKAHVNSYATNGCSGLHVTPLYTAPPAQASAWVAERYTCIGKGGSYLRVGTSIGAGDNRGEIVEVYRDESNGQLYHRDTENFFVRMTAAPTPGASDGKGGE